VDMMRLYMCSVYVFCICVLCVCSVYVFCICFVYMCFVYVFCICAMYMCLYMCCVYVFCMCFVYVFCVFVLFSKPHGKKPLTHVISLSRSLLLSLTRRHMRKGAEVADFHVHCVTL